MDKGACQAAVHGFAKSLSNFHDTNCHSLTFSFEVLQKIISQIFFHSKLYRTESFILSNLMRTE